MCLSAACVLAHLLPIKCLEQRVAYSTSAQRLAAIVIIIVTLYMR